jgi:hypothetical protein
VLAASLLFCGQLRAQLDPKLQADKTSFLDLYQQSTTVKPKPEIVTVFDFSGSMDALMFHPLFQNLNVDDNSSTTTIYIWLPSSGAVTNASAGDSASSNTFSVSLGNNTNTTLTLTFRNLIKPDGSIVTATDAESCGGLKSENGTTIVAASSRGMYTGTSSVTNRDVRHWLLAASHARFQCTTAQSNVSWALNRTIDIPLPWKIMDCNSTGNPLSSKTINDPRKTKVTKDQNGKDVTINYGSGQDIELDTTYKIPYAFRNSAGTLTTSTNYIGKFAYTPRTGGGSIAITCSTSGGAIGYKTAYLHWLFAGRWQNSTDGPTSSASNTNYYLPANGMYYTNETSMAGKFIVFDAMATSASLLAAGQTSADWGKGFKGQLDKTTKIKIPKYKLDGKLDKVADDYAYKYVTPAVTRVQATKVAAIQTWIKHQADVFWAYRFLDRGIADSNDNQYRNTNTMHASSRDGITSFNPSTLMTNTSPPEWVTGKDHGWQVLNKDSVNGMKRIAATFAITSTPLTYAMAGTLAQLNDAKNVFNDVMPHAEISQCGQTFVILFTDGIDNIPTGTAAPTSKTPYIDDPNKGLNAMFNAAMGNRAVNNNPAGIEPRNSNSWFNVQTYAALAAHMTDASLGGVKGSDYIADAHAQTDGTDRKAISSFLPFAIKGREGYGGTPGEVTNYGVPRRVTTMTVGVSLFGRTTDFVTAVNPKLGLFLAAVMGDVSVPNGRIGDFRPFTPPVITYKSDGTTVDKVEAYNDWEVDPANPESYPTTGRRKTGAAYFFDATDPDSLTSSLETAFQAAISAGSNNATSTPNIPFVGASFGGQVYMGNFEVPNGGNVIWTGDLFMFGLREEDGQAKILGKGGVPTQVLNSETAIWSASKVIKNWKDRRLYTRLPGTSELKRFADDGDDFTNATTGLQKYIELSDSTMTEQDKVRAKRKIVQFAMGADTLRDSSDRPANNRSNIMGDIIDSAPEAIEYQWDIVKNDLAKYPDLAAVSGNNPQFRLILVGTNQGWLHAFGEVSVKAKDANNKEYVTGNVAELWSFMPTDFLKNLGYITLPGNIHRFMVDGTPVIYHLDIPSKADGIGDGIVNHGERVLAVFGLGKGGRSYYALNIEDPFNPKIQWTLVPDEASTFPASSIELGCDKSADAVQKMLGRWGFSTGAPAFGRIIFNGSNGRQLRDAVFLGGGFSVPEIEAQKVDRDMEVQFKGSSYGMPLGPLGRSIMALDVYTGKVLAAEELPSDAGPVGAGMVPFEFIINSGTAQRAYFLDFKGGLWAWGSVETERSDPYRDFRIDTSEINHITNPWKLRKVYQDTSATENRRYTVAPAPFRVSNFPGEGIKSGSFVQPARPPAVGIAMVSGDRNNPLDRYGGEFPPGPQPNVHRLTVVFDRQDNNAWIPNNGPITDVRLWPVPDEDVKKTPTNLCSDSIFKYVTPGCDDFYLAPKQGNQQGTPSFGYYLNFPTKDRGFTPKGINPPMVVSDSLYYTIFTPQTSDPCSGGLGKSESWVIADVVNPLKQDSRDSTEGERFASGKIGEWAGVGSDFIQMGTRGVLQGGTALGDSGMGIELKTTTTRPAEGFPKPRVWRVVR